MTHLDDDCQGFHDGDLVEIGERGITLSGGQKARVGLARALYSQADVYLLDDPLSALDSRIGRAIFTDCIMTFLKGKTVVLVTHQLQFLKDVQHIILLE